LKAFKPLDRITKISRRNNIPSPFTVAFAPPTPTNLNLGET